MGFGAREREGQLKARKLGLPHHQNPLRSGPGFPSALHGDGSAELVFCLPRKWEPRTSVRLAEQGQRAGSWDDQPWAPSLLTGAFGDLIRSQAAAAKKKAEETGIPADPWMQVVHFHTLRHTQISQLLMQGVPLKVASARAGHASVSIRADIYGHLLPGADEQAAAQLGTFLSTPPAAQTG